MHQSRAEQCATIAVLPLKSRVRSSHARLACMSHAHSQPNKQMAAAATRTPPCYANH